MDSPLATLRRNAPQATARQFLDANPGSWIQYYDDTPVRDPTKALSARTFDPAVARRKQVERCAVTFSLQPFWESRTKDQLLCFRTLGADIDLIAPPARATLPADALDRRKDEYLRAVLLAFPLAPHWLIETRHGFHVLFRVEPQREPRTVTEAESLNRRLVGALHGDPHAMLLTQLLRVPGTLQFKLPDQPFLCRLLVDNAARIDPYPLPAVRRALDAWMGSRGETVSSHPDPVGMPRWREGLTGVPTGARNATATALTGKLLRRLPEELWEIGGWGGLREWNTRNPVPLPDRELRSVFASIARRERRRRDAREHISKGPSTQNHAEP